MNDQHDSESQRARILDEIEHWQSINQDQSKQHVTVYIDLKSPHAYLAVRPSLQLAHDYHVYVNFLPFTLSYVELGVSTEVSETMERKPLNEAADRKARMYYAAAREYAKIQDLPFRSPYRLLDSTLAHKAFLYAKHQNLEIPFMLYVYTKGWGSGWRDFELESFEAVSKALSESDVSLDGFKEFASNQGKGVQELQGHILAAEKSGIAGVPHYVLDECGESKRLSLFGREHLSLIRLRLAERGLAKNDSISHDFPHTWPR